MRIRYDDETQVMLLPDYGRKKLLGYADTFRELAHAYEEEETQPGVLLAADRREQYVRQVERDNRQVLSKQLLQLAGIMTDVADETYSILAFPEKKRRLLIKTLRLEGVDVESVHRIRLNSEGDRVDKLCLTMRMEKGDALSCDDVAGMLSVILNSRYLSTADSPFFLGREYEDFYFVEESRYHSMTGAVRAPKDTEKTSGDNFFLEDNGEGMLHMVLSDGMGSGEEACRDSSLVTDTMEGLLRAGFDGAGAIAMVNHIFYCGAGGWNIATLDYCQINLYTGVACFYKAGCAASYIKRGRMVEQISSQNLPLGAISHQDIEPEERDLLAGDYVILVSDGVLDSFSQGIGEDMLVEAISQMDLTGPGEMANYLLNYCLRQAKGHIRDDLTILVAGIWD